MATRTVGERDRARGSEVTRPRSEERARQTLAKRRERVGPKRSEDAETVGEALEIERDAGRREGAAAKADRPIVRYGPKGSDRVDAPAASTLEGPSPARARTASASSSSSSSSVPGVTAPMVIDILIITADEIVTQHRAPIPSRLLVAFMVFGALGLAKGEAAKPAKVFAWGIVVATFYSIAPGGKPPALGALNALGDFLGGKMGKKDYTAKLAGSNPSDIPPDSAIVTNPAYT